MKKMILSTALLSAVFLGSIQVASAAEVKKEETPVGIEFEEITDKGEGPFKGVLSLTFKPSQIEFGKTKATGAILTSPAKNLGGENKKEWLVINDDRENTEAVDELNDKLSVKGGGWNLTAKMAKLQKEDGSDLPATLNMNFDSIQGYVMGTTMNKAGNDYEPNHPNDAGSIVTMPANSNIVLTPAVQLEAGGATEVTVLNKGKATTDKVGVATELKSANLVTQAAKGYGGKLTSSVTWTLSTSIDDVKP